MNDLAERRRLGRSAVTVSPLGFGGNALSNLYAPVDEDAAVDAVAAAYEGGARYFDTAPLVAERFPCPPPRSGFRCVNRRLPAWSRAAARGPNPNAASPL